MTTAPEPTASETLHAAAACLEAVAVDAALVAADRAYLTATASRLRALAVSLASPPEAVVPSAPEPEEPPHRPERTWSRSVAARRAGVAPNTLINLESRGLLTPRRDARGWRVYTRADIEAARTYLHHRVTVPETE